MPARRFPPPWSFTVPSVTAFFNNDHYSGLWGQRIGEIHALHRLRIGDLCCRAHRRIRDWFSASGRHRFTLTESTTQ
jgi:hypothetical protein